MKEQDNGHATEKTAGDIINSVCKPYGGFVNVITNCGGSLVSACWRSAMEEYASIQTASLRKQLDALNKRCEQLAELNQRGDDLGLELLVKSWDRDDEITFLRKQLEERDKEIERLKAVVEEPLGKYVVFHRNDEGLEQLSIGLNSLFDAKAYIGIRNPNRPLYIFREVLQENKANEGKG